MVGLQNGHKRKNLTQNGELQRNSWEHRRRKMYYQGKLDITKSIKSILLVFIVQCSTHKHLCHYDKHWNRAMFLCFKVGLQCFTYCASLETMGTTFTGFKQYTKHCSLSLTLKEGQSQYRLLSNAGYNCNTKSHQACRNITPWTAEPKAMLQGFFKWNVWSVSSPPQLRINQNKMGTGVSGLKCFNSTLTLILTDSELRKWEQKLWFSCISMT